MTKRLFPIAILLGCTAFAFAGGSWTHKLWAQSRSKIPSSLLVVYECGDKYFGGVLTLTDGTILPLPADEIPLDALEGMAKALGREHVGAVIACSEAPDASKRTL